MISGTMRLMCVSIGLTLTMTDLAHAQETSSADEAASDETLVDANDQKLDRMLTDLGVTVDKTATVEPTEDSWTDKLTGWFERNESSNETASDADSSASFNTTLTPPDADTASADQETLEPTAPSVEAPTATDVAVAKANAGGAAQTDGNLLATNDSIATAEPAPTTRPSLDDVLREAGNTPQAQDDRFRARLVEQRELALALRSTLEAAEQVARFGDAGEQLLQQASLETIVTAMVKAQERERQESQEASTPIEVVSASPIPATPNATVADEPTGFAAWQPVYIVSDARGYRVGWRHQTTGERITTYVGETSMFGSDAVEVIGVSRDARGRFVTLDVNESRQEVHVF